ncbi:MAG: pyrroloquinoline quinone biosynthesis protein PqqB [Steroidobacter sp.]
MNIRILGAAAGGGFPQWNCNCRNCRGVRTGQVNARRRTQSSIAIRGADEFAWTLVNASPDILAQLHANPQLQPARSNRDTGIRNIVLTDSQVDHTTGLFMLREHVSAWPIWCTDNVFADLTHGNPILQVMQRYCGVNRQRVDVDGGWFTVDGVEDLRWQAVALTGRSAPYSSRRETPEPGDVIALFVEDLRSGHRLFYAPALASIEPHVFELMRDAHCVLVDGTFWSEDEMLQMGVGRKRAADMGHLPQSGPGGMIEWLDRLPPATRRILIHINNTNPILIEDSPERAVLRAHDIEVAHDGMEISL